VSRGLISARTVGLSAVAAVLVAAMVWLGRWQYDAYDEHQADDAEAVLARPALPLDAVLTADAPFPTDAVSRPVIASGRYVPSEQFYVTGSASAGAALAVVTPLVTDSGSALLVVRGLSDDRAAPPPVGQIEVDGVLEPSDESAAPLSDVRTTDGIQIARLVGTVDEDLYAGYLVARSTNPPDPLSPAPIPQPDASPWAGFRNLLYALQWWTFAAFVVFMWWRAIRDPRSNAPRPDNGAPLERASPRPGGTDRQVG
jgi:cytochrome oxidase assembly protein ShyY1